MADQSLSAPRSPFRLHRSTYLIGAIAGLLLLRINLTWIYTEEYLDSSFTDHWGGTRSSGYSRGWPWSHSTCGKLGDPGFGGDPWWNIAGLSCDLGIGLVLVLAAMAGFETWRRRRARVHHFYLAELFIAAACVAVACAYYAQGAATHRQELAVLRQIDDAVPGASYFDYESRANFKYHGPDWLRRLLGEHCPAEFDRVVLVNVEPKEIEFVDRLRKADLVGIFGLPSSQELKALERLPLLERLTIWQDTADNAFLPFRLPRVRQLRFLTVTCTSYAGEGLEDNPQVEVLYLAETGVDDAILPVLGNMKHLRMLDLTATKITRVDELARLQDLEFLSVGKTAVDDRSIPVLCQLKKLRWLHIDSTQISDAGVATIERAHPECNFDCLVRP